MSYEPTLIINKNDLDSKASEIESDAIEYEDDHIIKYIAELLKKPSIKIMGIEIIICNPELTRFNKLVREQLYEYDIEYAEDI